MTKNTRRLVFAIVFGILVAISCFGPRLIAAGQAQSHLARTPAKVNTSEYRALAVPPNLANPSGPAQPIPYSHKLHMTLGLACSTCHQSSADGAQMTLPTAQTCMNCHKSVAADKAPIEKLATYAKSDKPIPWVRVYVLLKGVNFSHKTHIASEVQCETCHGPVSGMDVTREATSVTSMAVCMKCHAMNNASNSCVTCHDAWGRDMVVVKKPGR